MTRDSFQELSFSGIIPAETGFPHLGYKVRDEPEAVL